MTNASTSTTTPASVSSTTNWGSRSPGADSADDRPAYTVARTSSWSSSQRTQSISCTTVSVMIISDVKVGATAGLRWTQCTSTGAPIVPAATSRLSSA